MLLEEYHRTSLYNLYRSIQKVMVKNPMIMERTLEGSHQDYAATVSGRAIYRADIIQCNNAREALCKVISLKI